MLLLLISQIVNVTHISLVAFLEDIIVFSLTNFVLIGMEVNQSARHLQLIINNVLDFQICVEIKYVLIYKLPIYWIVKQVRFVIMMEQIVWHQQIVINMTFHHKPIKLRIVHSLFLMEIIAFLFQVINAQIQIIVSYSQIHCHALL